MAYHRDPVCYKVDKNGTRYYATDVCPKCGGEGYLHGYEHVDGARCWRCDATGRLDKLIKWKEYTPEYARVLNERRHARQQAKAKKEAPAYNAKFLARHGFALCEEHIGTGYLILGNTYGKSDVLKEHGAKWTVGLNWVAPEPIEGFTCVPIFADGVMHVEEETYHLVFRPLDEMEAYLEAAKPVIENKSEYVGEVGDKLSVAVTFDRHTSFDTQFGLMNIYIFTDSDGNVYKWKTSTCGFDEAGNFLELDKPYTMRGTIKAHEDYKGTKQTVLTRCKFE